LIGRHSLSECITLTHHPLPHHNTRQTELDTVSGVSLDLDVFKTKLRQLLLRTNSNKDNERRLSTIAPLGGGTSRLHVFWVTT